MCNRNATASWSGYSHQGQVGLLVALRKMREAGIDLSSHFVQFETREDVAIYELIPGAPPSYKTIHQVKAYYSNGNGNKSKYNDVLNGNFDNGGEKFLHTVVDIRDWDTSATTNGNNVIRYPYTPTKLYCGTTEIELFIKAELMGILNETDTVIIEAYNRLSFELDHRIRFEHQKAHKNLFDIKFCFAEIDAIIRCRDIFEKKEINDCRKLFYDTYAEILKNEDLEQTRIEFIEENIIKNINALDDDDFLSFLQRLNLNETPERLKRTQICYNSPGMEQIFFRLIIDVIATDPNLVENVIKYQVGREVGIFVITAIMKEERDQLSVVENILSNMQSQNLLWENHSLVNKNINIDIAERNPSINNIPTAEDQYDKKNRFMSFTGSKLVKREDAIQKLNNEGNN